VEIFTPTPGHPKSAEPTLLFTPIFLKRGQSYQAFGFQFNGVSQGAAYGDDIQAATNYPLVRITNIINGNVQFARTHDHSTMAVASNGLVSTHFDVSANQEPCICKLEVVANGIAESRVCFRSVSECGVSSFSFCFASVDGSRRSLLRCGPSALLCYCCG
jgi:hypothetical protein